MSSTPEVILQLVETFDRNIDNFKKQTYNEAQVRQQFLNPFFEALGWDMQNKAGIALAYSDVIHEDAIKVGGSTKAPDYCFRIGGTRKFFLEAKKPSVDIKSDISPAYQLRRYAWSAKLPLSILTDFEEFAIYDCQIRPNVNDKASTARIFLCTYKEYADKWQQIVDIFSKEAVLKGGFDRFAAAKTKKGTTTVDKEFLAEIENWRNELAKNIAMRNSSLSVYDLNFAVQKTIDRILFLRICEDRGIERSEQLLGLVNGQRVYPRLYELFEKADERYNSGIFHFHKEKDRPQSPDEMSANLKIDDDVLKKILKDLYYPQSPYEFSAMPAEILGNVYEQFLGKVIRLTAGHQAKVEEKPEVKKAGGVYYTPAYIVEYIVKNTVGKLCEGKTPKQIEKIKILDPACGSGSFLIGAYQYLLDWHRDYYVKEPAKHRKQVYQGKGGLWFLTIEEKKKILLNNIFGVDIDSQAVEVTKLSLLLKVLENETQESLRLFHERALPDLGANIKCGNSLIGPDFYDNQQLSLFDDEQQRKVNAFNWRAEFAEVFQDISRKGAKEEGGFDCVIGNPPYVRQETIGEFKEYFQRHYKVYHGVADLYSYFVEKGINLLKKGGIFSYIVANKWLRANYAEPLRRWLREQHIEQIIDFGNLPVFKPATTYPCILVISKNSTGSCFKASQVKTLDFQDLNEYVEQNNYQVKQTALNDSGWYLIDSKAQTLLQKLYENGIPLEEYVGGKIYRGVLTGLNEAFVIDSETRDALIKKDKKSIELIRPFLLGRDVKRYQNLRSTCYLIFSRRGIDIDQYSAIRDYLMAFKQSLMPKPKDWKGLEWRGRKPGTYSWFEIQDTISYHDEFNKPKIIYPNICKRPEFTFDDEGIFTNQKCFILPVDDKYLLGVLNSSLTYFLFREILPKLRGGFYEPSYVYFSKFPIYQINASSSKEKGKHDKMVSLVEQMLELNKKIAEVKNPEEKTRIQRQIDATDCQIDKLVYELYGLTEEEIKIVEGAAK